MQSSILTYYRLRKKESLIAMGSNQGGGGGGGSFISASAVPQRGERNCYLKLSETPDFKND